MHVCASMAPAINRRSSSFHLLSRDSPGDGELLPSPTNDKSLEGDRHRRRRRNRNKKSNLSQPTLELGLGPGLVEDEGSRSAVSTPGVFMDSDGHRSSGQESFLQWDTMPSVLNSCVSTDLAACRSQFSKCSLPSSSHNVEELVNGSHVACNGMPKVDSNGQMQASNIADGVLAYTYVKKDAMSGQHSMEERRARENSYHSDSTVLVPVLDKEGDQPTMVKGQQGQSGSVETTSAESRLPDGADHSYPSFLKFFPSLSCNADDGHASSTFRSTKEDPVFPGVISEVELFVDDGSTSWSNQSSRAELRQRTSHSLAKDSLQCVSHHAVEAPVQSKENQASSTTASECGTRDENKDSQGAGHDYQTPDKTTHVPVMHAETPHLLDWEQLLSANSLCEQLTVLVSFHAM